MGLSKPSGARILQESDDYVQVSFDQPGIHGCTWEFLGKDANVGWVAKKDITYADDGADDDSEVKVVDTPDEPAEPEHHPLELTVTRPRKNPCPAKEISAGSMDDIDPTIQNVGDLINHIRAKDSGMKSLNEVKKYIACYPLSEKGAKNLNSYEPFMDKITHSFSIAFRSETLNINPSLFRCLLRRESGFDPASLSFTGAVGVGQHTNINIEHISSRIKNPKSWEHKLWNQFFTNALKDPKARALMESCPGAKKGMLPTFNSKKDAACPLSSLAASGIYILEIQKALRQSSSARTIAWNQDLEYELAVGASYNLGDGAAGKAVDDLLVDGWVDAIQNRPSNKQKKQEVKNHISALRNCLEDKNWKPMTPGDHPVCKNLQASK